MRGRRLVALASSAILLAALLPGAAGAAQPAPAGGLKALVAPSENGIYIVQMIDEPVVAYEGGVQGLNATAPAGSEDRPDAPKVINYQAYLNGKHDAALAAVGGSKLYDYIYTFNGFAAKLTEEQAAELAVGQASWRSPG